MIAPAPGMEQRPGESTREHMIRTQPEGGVLIELADMPHADIKAIFAADGTFNIETDGRVSL